MSIFFEKSAKYQYKIKTPLISVSKVVFLRQKKHTKQNPHQNNF